MPQLVLKRVVLPLISAFMVSLAAYSDASAVEPGEYLYVEGGRAHGALVVKNGRFTLDTIGANCHTCSLAGTLEGTTAVAREAGETCHISIRGNHGRLALDSSNSDACRSYCGTRAMFDGQYRQAPAACTDHSRVSRLRHARELYAKKDYASADGAFTALIDECSMYMDWIEADRVRNDLSLTQHHLGDNAKCLATLSKTVALSYRSKNIDTDASFGLPPCDATNYESIGKAILYNATLCKGSPASATAK